MRKEIGSEFWNVPISDKKNNLFPIGTKWFLSGRSALVHIIEDIKKRKEVHTVALPSWCCDSMIAPFKEAHIDVQFYPVYMESGKLVQKVTILADVVLVIDYFGYSGDEDYSDYSGIVIRDLTHSIFSNQHTDADYYFGSLRKWCGIWTGGFAWAKYEFSESADSKEVSKEYIHLREKAMRKKEDYINGLSDSKEFLELFHQAEKILEHIPIKNMLAAERDIKAAHYMDVELIKKKRRQNATVLHEGLSDLVVFKKMKDRDCPLFVPILTENRDKLHGFLIKNKIYCPVHWPISGMHSLTERLMDIYDKEISLICDQRYSTDDMKQICEIVRKGIKEC